MPESPHCTVDEICQRDRRSDLLKGVTKSHQTGQLCDVILQVGSTAIPAHRVVLASSSPYFSAMFSHAMRESQSEQVEIRDMDEAALVQLVNFIYTGKILVNTETVLTLFPAANLLQLNFVRDACCRFLASQLDPKNCLTIHGLAKLHDCSDLAQSCHRYLEVNFAEVAEQNADFLELGIEELEQLLASDKLCVTEDRLFEAVNKWLGHNPHERQQYAQRLFRHVRFGLMSRDKLRQLVGFQEFWEANPWSQAQLLPTLTSIVGGALFKPRDPKVILVVGGFHNERSVEYFDLQSLRWNSSEQTLHSCARAAPKIPDMPHWRCGFGAVELNGLMYIMGGCVSGQIDEDDGTDSVDILDTTTLRWSVGPPMQCPRVWPGACVLDGKIYVIGGSHKASDLSSAEVLDSSDQWRCIAPLPDERSYLGVAAFRGKLYVIGYSYGEDDFLSYGECYDPLTNTWTSIGRLNTPRQNLGMCVLNDRLYAVGGDVDSGCSDNTAEVYNPDNDTWQPIASMHERRRGFGLVAHDGFLYAVGGRKEDNLGSIERYDPSDDTWTLLPGRINDERYQAGVAIVRLPLLDC